MKNSRCYIAVVTISLMCAASTSNHYYILPSSNITDCPQEPCYTLSQFALISGTLNRSQTNGTVSLLLSSGQHLLDKAISLAHEDNVVITKDKTDKERVTIICINRLGKVSINDTTSASLKGLHFIGCVRNTLSRVKQLFIDDVIFQGAEGRYMALLLNNVTNATISKSSFSNNTFGILPPTFLFFFDPAVLDHVYFEQNTSFGTGGALHAINSNISIINSHFSHNSVGIGGAILARRSTLNIASSTFTKNNATFGGVIVTSESTVDINSYSVFSDNTAYTGAVMMAYNDSLTIRSSNFSRNEALLDGGVMVVYESLLMLADSIFEGNEAGDQCGVVCVTNSPITSTNTTFATNSASFLGGVVYLAGECSIIVSKSTFDANSADRGGVLHTSTSEDDCSIYIESSAFIGNYADLEGGVLHVQDECSINIINCTFAKNTAGAGGVLNTGDSCSFIITSSIFRANKAQSTNGGGVLYSTGCNFSLSANNFTSNHASHSGGVMTSQGENSFNISECSFTNNSAVYRGGVMFVSGQVDNSLFWIKNSLFHANSARDGGVVDTVGSEHTDISISIVSTDFSQNYAEFRGGIIRCSNTSMNIQNSNVSFNRAAQYGGIMLASNCSTHIIDCLFYNNSGSLYVFNSNLTLSGSTVFENGKEPTRITSGNLFIRREGGAITGFQSTIILGGTSSFLNNQAIVGGAVMVVDSTMLTYGDTTIESNMATRSGGGIALHRSSLQIKGNCWISSNRAERGGGVHAASSTINIHHRRCLQVNKNSAELGGGVYLEVDSRINLLKTSIYYDIFSLMFTANSATKYGGGVYVDDNSNAGACESDIECFIQIIALHSDSINSQSGVIPANIRFLHNVALERGSDLFGGLLDRCTPSLFAEVLQIRMQYYNGLTYFEGITQLSTLNSVSSEPLRLCFCNKSVMDQDCSYQPPPIRVRRGETFTVSLVAVDQVDHTVAANIITSLSSSSEGGLGEGQQTQTANETCTDLTFNVFSSHDIETLTLYTDGPCGNADLSTRLLTVEFLNCTCPIGLEPLTNSQSETRCECDCDSDISAYLSSCNSTTGALTRSTTNAWITYVNDTDPPGFIIHPNCPFDYCLPPSEDVSFNFNLPEGADALCANNRRGVLCGACRQNFSLSLGSSRCLPCEFYWPGILVVIIVAFIAAGILLVTALLALNMTVAVGLIDNFIFYANIVAAGSSVFFPSTEPSFPVVFVAWLNLDIGFDVCFFDGLDAYTKTWLQLAFPVYIISLVVVVIIVSEYSPKFASLIGKRDPIATLATLILLSYAKLLSVTITALSFANLDYPDGSRETVWLADGNVKYFQEKHIPFALVALLITSIGLPYTIILFLWQWLVRAPRWKVFKWTRHSKLNAFIAAYHVPCTSKYRYWTGLLLLVRVILYITAAVSVSVDPNTIALVTSSLIAALFLFKGFIGLRVYKKSFVDIVATVMYFNLLIFSTLSLYDLKDEGSKQTALAHVSAAITLFLLAAAIVYHLSLLVRKTPVDENTRPLDPVPPTQPAAVTHSVIELSNHQEDNNREAECIVTPPYLVTETSV